MIDRLLRRTAFHRNYVAPVRAALAWKKRGFANNAPQVIKQSVLERNGPDNATWIETGTFLGTTTAFLEQSAVRVYTIEPEPRLYEAARQRFQSSDRVTVLNGISEEILPDLLPTLTGNVSFWLDGHYSAGVTYKGPVDCPVDAELAAISANIERFDDVAVLIDDVRCFLPENEIASYPSIDKLVDWAREHSLYWHIEHDIFVARNFKVANSM